MKFTVEIDCDKLTKWGDSDVELARLLRCLATRIEREPGVLPGGSLIDANGDVVGMVRLTE